MGETDDEEGDGEGGGEEGGCVGGARVEMWWWHGFCQARLVVSLDVEFLDYPSMYKERESYDFRIIRGLRMIDRR